jgi:hypothetical protein
MSKQVYFVIAVDLDEKAPFIDDDTFTAMFSKSQQVWDTVEGVWIDDPELELYNQALEILNSKPLASD